MRPTFEGKSGRHQHGHSSVVDQDSGNVIGHVRVVHGSGRFISLFDGKYEATLPDEAQCRGFMKGVVAVIHRMSSTDDGRAELERELFELRNAQKRMA
jgi:hypothetical protein